GVNRGLSRDEDSKFSRGRSRAQDEAQERCCVVRARQAARSRRSAPRVPGARYLPNELVGEVGNTVTEDLGVDAVHGFLVAGLAEEALAGPEHEREDLQPQLVDEVVLDQRAQELEAAGDDDLPA